MTDDWTQEDGYEIESDLGYATLFRRTARKALFLYSPEKGTDPIVLVDAKAAKDLVAQLQHWIDTGRIKDEPEGESDEVLDPRR